MPIHADDAQRIYLQSKKRRLTETLHRIDNELKDILNRGYTSLKTRLVTSYNDHNNNDIWEDVVKYYNDLGWSIRADGYYVIIAPDPKRKPKPQPQVYVQVQPQFEVSGGLPSGRALDLAAQLQQQQQDLINARLGSQREQTFQFKPEPPPTRLIPDTTSEALQKLSQQLLTPFKLFWAWFKEVMK